MAQVSPEERPTSDTIKLEWKLPAGDTLRYQTVMTEIDESTFEMDFGGMLGQLMGDSTLAEENKETASFFNKFREAYNNIDFVTVLTNSEHFAEVLEIELLGLPREEKEDSFMAEMMQGTMLRGSVYKTGGLHSFWVKTSQKNLISTLFELPKKPLVEGESWTLPNVSFIANDQNFTCHEATQHNQVTLVAIRQEGEDTIATIEYDIREYVTGEFKAPSFMGGKIEPQATSMHFIHRAQAEFSVNQGKWISYNGILSMNGTGLMKAKQRQKIALIEAED